jgi:REP element-mobilizing transposase RayT
MEPSASAPLAYFITFHTYGTWLPGNPRGSVDAHHRAVGTPYVGWSEGRQSASTARLAHPPIELCPEERTIILCTTQEVCARRGWALLAAHIRVNHVHAVIRAEHGPERVMNDLKTWSTRRVIEAGLRPPGTRLWVRHGSTRHLWRPEVVSAACVYVVERQGEGGGGQWAIGGSTAC